MTSLSRVGYEPSEQDISLGSSLKQKLLLGSLGSLELARDSRGLICYNLFFTVVAYIFYLS